MYKRVVHTALTVTAFAVPSVALASSFQLLEQSPAQMGKAFAGTASDITDASTVYFNPAGMARLDRASMTVGANVVATEARFIDDGSTFPGEGGVTDEDGFIPNVYLVLPMENGVTVGFGAGGPFGLSSDFGTQWPGRYSATFSELEVMNLNVNAAWAPNDWIAFGLGVNYQSMDVTLESQVDSTLGVNPSPATDSSAVIEGDDSDFVFDFSVLLTPTEATRIGLSWRQGGEFSLDGDAVFNRNAACAPGQGFPTGAPPAPTTGTLCAGTLAALEGPVAANVELPDTLTLSLSHQVNDRWALHADVAQTRWSSIQDIAVINVNSGAAVDQLDLRYDDTLRVALGTTLNVSEHFTWRIGVAQDESPQTDPEFVSARIPDQDRTWVATGVNWAFSDHVSIDVSYAHLSVDDANLLDVDETSGRTLRGAFDNKVEIYAAQLNWAF
ncbi:OmpP1/FadL family transporter [Marinimicrobium sp. ARAG 43.8]|uniref:OmpP1/FadL family transporter n=1 Tax=Marinimicrobium sp. ARAG 43.8 TaxID=3418719 RepID=UPI003CEA7258